MPLMSCYENDGFSDYTNNIHGAQKKGSLSLLCTASEKFANLNKSF